MTGIGTSIETTRCFIIFQVCFYSVEKWVKEVKFLNMFYIPALPSEVWIRKQRTIQRQALISVLKNVRKINFELRKDNESDSKLSFPLEQFWTLTGLEPIHFVIPQKNFSHNELSLRLDTIILACSHVRIWVGVMLMMSKRQTKSS